MLVLIISVISNADFFSVHVTCCLQQAIHRLLTTERHRSSLLINVGDQCMPEHKHTHRSWVASYIVLFFFRTRQLVSTWAVNNDGALVSELDLVMPSVLHVRELSEMSDLTLRNAILLLLHNFPSRSPLVLVFRNLRCVSKEFRQHF